MKTEKVVNARIDDVIFGWFDPETEEFYSLEETKNIEALIADKRCTELLIGAIVNFFDDFKTELKKDLVDMWEKVDRL